MFRIFNRNEIMFKLGKSLKQTVFFPLSAFHKVLSAFQKFVKHFSKVKGKSNASTLLF
jgi:hypothetical protein